jgi:hypothetical protein
MKAMTPRRRAWVYVFCAAIYAGIVLLALCEAVFAGERSRGAEVRLAIYLGAMLVVGFCAVYTWRTGR